MVDRYATDPAMRATTFVVLDFEGTTPTGAPAEPIEVGAVLLQLHGGPEGWRLGETGRFEALIRPPAHAPVTALDTRQTGITPAMVTGRPDAATVLSQFDATLTAPPYVTVAHHAATEAGILRRYATACPSLATAPMLDTIRLAQHTCPGLPNYQLDTVLTHLGIPVPAGRHRALPDASATATALRHLLTAGSTWLAWSRLSHLHAIAGAAPPHQPDAQQPLF
ncbi:3'-5' exonuclease [Dactylosporangium sp. NPDC006015]|uniref:3'-5' exonuclease n=1 Tax=Dactylosporangium sp. NPDC006015 TaxID=3154576 RepID=UPI0033A7C171